jgi:acyl-CoA dehydrogenase
MISFQPSDDEIAFVQLAKDLAQDYIRPMARETEKNKKVPETVTRKLHELGFTQLELPESYGGLELPLVSQVQILEALSWGDMAVIQGVPGINEVSSFIRQDPDNPLFQSFKLQLDLQPTVSFVPYHQSLKIETSTNGYLLNGTTLPVKMGESAQYLLIAGEDEKGETILLWLDNSKLWNRKSGDYRLGLLASKCARLQFDSVEVSNQQILTTGHEASRILKESMARIRVLEAAKEVGTMSAALQYVTEYTAQRKAFGQEIAKFQGVSFNVAQMAIQTHAARNLTLFAAKKLDQQEPDGVSSSLSALNFAHRTVRFVTDSAVQLLGGHGYVQDHLVEKWMRDAQAQVNLFETEEDLLSRSGEYMLLGQERRGEYDLLRTHATPKSS